MSIQQLFFSGGAPDQITATGGTINTVGDYRYHTFYSTSSITFTAYNSSSYTINMWMMNGGNDGANGDDNPDAGQDGRAGGGGGQSGEYRIQSTTAGVFGLNTARTVEVAGAQGTSAINASTIFNGNGGGVTSGGYGGAGGNAGTVQGDPGASGDAGTEITSVPFNNSPAISPRSGGGGGGGGGGGFATFGSGGGGGGGGLNGGGSGGGGGYGAANGDAAESASANTGAGGGGGGGAGGSDFRFGGSGGSGGSGFVVIAYKYRNN